MSKSTSTSIITALVTISSTKKFTMARKGLAQQHQKGIQVLPRVISIFLVARLTICYIESIIYIMSLDIIREATITTAKFNSVKVHQVILQCQYQGIIRQYRLIAASSTWLGSIQLYLVGVVLQVIGEYIYLLTPALIISIADFTAKGKGQVLYLKGDIFLKQIHFLFLSLIYFNY